MTVREHFPLGGLALLHPIIDATEQTIAAVLDDAGGTVPVG